MDERSINNLPPTKQGKEPLKVLLWKIYLFHNSRLISSAWGHWIRLCIEHCVLIDGWLAPLILWSISIRCILLTVMVPLDYSNTFMIRWYTGISHSKRYWLQLRSFEWDQDVLIGRALQLMYLWPWPMWLMGRKTDCGFSGVVWDPRLSQMCKSAV